MGMAVIIKFYLQNGWQATFALWGGSLPILNTGK